MKYLTQTQIGPFLREHGYPYGDSTIQKLCSPAIGGGPPIAAWQGKRPLRTPEGCIAWAESRLRLARPEAPEPPRPAPRHTQERVSTP